MAEAAKPAAKPRSRGRSKAALQDEVAAKAEAVQDEVEAATAEEDLETEEVEASAEETEVERAARELREALEADRKGKTVRVVIDGESYYIPPLRKWPIDVFELDEEGLNVRATKKLLGNLQWLMWKSQPDPENPGLRIERDEPRTAEEAANLFRTLTEAARVPNS